MERTLTRTERVEMHEQTIQELLKDSIDFQTLARSFDDLAEEIEKISSRGDLWDKAQLGIVCIARAKARLFREKGRIASERAAYFREKGVTD